MEYSQETITQEQYEELKKIAAENLCSVCGAELQIHTDPARKTLTIGCFNREHKGFTERQSYTQMMRHGETLPDIIESQVKKRMMPANVTAADLERSIGLVHVKYPDVLRDRPTAALFIMDCMRLGLDPLISPPEVVPAVFMKKQRGARDAQGKDVWLPVIVEIITEDGALSGAARAEPEEWDGPPKTMPLLDYLLTLDHLKNRPLDEIERIADRQAEEISGAPGSWVWVALGKRKSQTSAESPAFGWYTRKEQEEDSTKGLIAGALPGNQARIRAIKRWTRETYPDWRQKMIEMRSEWASRSEGIAQAQKLIEAEYRIEKEPKTVSKTGPNVSESGKTVSKTPEDISSDEAFEKLESASNRQEKTIESETDRFRMGLLHLGLSEHQGISAMGSSLKKWLTVGQTVNDAFQLIGDKLARGEIKTWDKVVKDDVPDYDRLEKVYTYFTDKPAADMYKELGGGDRNSMTAPAWESFQVLRANRQKPPSPKA